MRRLISKGVFGFVVRPTDFARMSWVLTSPAEPLAYRRKLKNSLSLFLSKPSEMLEGTETDALSIWSRKAKSLQLENSLYRTTAMAIDSCQITRSSNDEILDIKINLYGEGIKL